MHLQYNSNKIAIPLPLKLLFKFTTTTIQFERNCNTTIQQPQKTSIQLHGVYKKSRQILTNLAAIRIQTVLPVNDDVAVSVHKVICWQKGQKRSLYKKIDILIPIKQTCCLPSLNAKF